MARPKFQIQTGQASDGGQVFFAEAQTDRAKKALNRAGFLHAVADSKIPVPACVPIHAWWTRKAEIAVHFIDFADETAKTALLPIAAHMEGSRATDSAEFDPSLVPQGKRPYGFQKAGVTFALRRFAAGKKGVLIADEMGLGKTPQSVLIANSLPRDAKILVLCPASVVSNWGAEWARWDTHNRRVSLVTDPHTKPNTDVLVINYDRFATAGGDDTTTALMTRR